MTAGSETTAIWQPAVWPAPSQVRAGTTTRSAVDCSGSFAAFNLALHVGDEPATVHHNRTRLINELQLPSEPIWLEQIHGNRIVNATHVQKHTAADGSYTDHTGIVCAVLTADCLPVLLCNRSGSEIAAVHVGWRGLCHGIIDIAVNKFNDPAERVLAWIGPHISAAHYEIGEEVRNNCLDTFSEPANAAFSPVREGHWLANLEFLARLALLNSGITTIYSCNRCTYAEYEVFYSYRRNRQTGRMASLIWLAPE